MAAPGTFFELGRGALDKKDFVACLGITKRKEYRKRETRSVYCPFGAIIGIPISYPIPLKILY
jgi:hypothetical protein